MKKYIILFSLVSILTLILVYNYFGVKGIIRLILGGIFISLAAASVFFLAVSIYARNLKYSLLSLYYLLLACFPIYSLIVWKNFLKFLLIPVLLLIISTIIIYLKLSEPEFGIIERFYSPERLEKKGKLYLAARKYEEKKNYEKAAELYLKSGYIESAAYVYEEAGKYKEAAELFEKIYEKEKDDYYLRRAAELYEKAGLYHKAARCYEILGNEEGYFLEDAAKLYEKAGLKDKAREIWKKVAEYYLKEAQEEPVFYEDVAIAYEKIGDKDKAREYYLKFAEYCIKEAEKDPNWLKYAKEVYEKLNMKDKIKEIEELERKIRKE